MELTNLLENLTTKNNPITFAVDFSLFHNRSLEAKGDSRCEKQQSLSKLLHFKKHSIYVMFGKCESLKQNNKLLDINISLKDA